jgi:hypothetical protein
LSAQRSLNHKRTRARRRCFGPDAP